MGRIRQPIATFCSLALGLWGYQTELWVLAIPMIVALEGREFVRRRWETSWPILRSLHILAGFIWFLSIVLLPPFSSEGLPYSASHQILRGLPIAFFPIILAQTYARNVGAIYHNLFRKYPRPTSQFNLYYPYFGVCLLAASATDGNGPIFLTIVLGLVAGVLWVTRSPRFSTSIFYILIVLALLISLGGAQQYYWLTSNIRLPNLLELGDLLPDISIGVNNNTTSTAWGPQDFEEEIVDIAQQPSKAPSSPSSENEPNPSSQGSPENSNDSTADFPAEISLGSDDSSVEQTPNTSLQTNDASPPQSPATTETLEINDDDLASISSPPITFPNHPNASTSSPSSTNSSNSSSSSAAASPASATSTATSSSLPGGIQQVGGLIDPQTSQTQIGALGSLQQSNAILFRVKPLNPNRQAWPHPLRIQETTYNQYRSGTWNVVESKFTPIKSQRDQSWSIADHTSRYQAEIIETVNTQSGFLKLPIGTSRINQLKVQDLKQNQYGAIAFQRAQTSDPLRFQVEFAPTQLAARRPNRQDKRVPKQEKPAIEAVLKSLKLDRKSDQEKVQAIANFFKQGFSYSLDFPNTPADQTPLSAFLRQHRSGHCEYYASATALLLRSAGIPARYVVGYSASEYDPSDQHYIVRLRDAHAWVMAYVNNRWITIDTTPSSGASQDRNGQDSVEEIVAQQTPAINPNNTYSNIPASQVENTSAANHSATPSNQTNAPEPAAEEPQPKSPKESWRNSLTDLGSSWMEQLNQLWTDIKSWIRAQYENVSQSIWFGAFLLLGIAIAISSGIAIWKLYRRPRIRRRLRRKQKRYKTQASRKADKKIFTFEDIEKRLQNWNLQRNSSETAKQWVSRLEDELSESQFRGLKEILDLHYRQRFDPKHFDQRDRQQLATLIQDWLGNLTHPTAKALK